METATSYDPELDSVLSDDVGDGTVDVCIIVPKKDEFRCTLQVFGLDQEISSLPELGNDMYPFARTMLGQLSIAIVLMDGQGNSKATHVAHTVKEVLHPAVVILSGTAAGNRHRVRLGDVRICERVVHITEWVDHDTVRSPRHEPRTIKNHIRRDAGGFVDTDARQRDFAQTLYGVLLSAYGDEIPDLENVIRKMDIAPITSGDVLSKANVSMDQIWAIDDRSEVYDMESGGVGLALSDAADLFWITIRAVSDLGNQDKDKHPQMRGIASYAAAVATRLFCLSGLSKAHPRTVRPYIVPSTRLVEDQHYAMNSSNQILDIVEERLGINLPVKSLARHITLDQFAIMLSSYGDRTGDEDYLGDATEIRRQYFVQKYLDYSYEDDLRGHFESSWHQEFREVLAWQGREELSSARVLNVGVSNGEELKTILTDAHEIVGVDIDEDLLERAIQVRPEMKTHCLSADNLYELEASSFDVYVSLRTLVCRFVDPRSAIAEALRILKPGGLLEISIPNGYREYRDGRSVIVPGLKEPGGSDFVDPLRPSQLLQEYTGYLYAFGFEKIYTLARLTDYYLSACKPGGPYTLSARLLAKTLG